MKAAYIILIMLLTIRCTPDNSQRKTFEKKIDMEFKINFDNCIQIVMLRQVECVKVECVTDYWNTVYAFECLNALTGVKSNVFVEEDAPYIYIDYDDKDYTESFYEDLIRWNDWYECNKFSITMKKADSLFAIHSEKIGDKIEWPQSFTQIFSSNPPPLPSRSKDKNDSLTRVVKE